MDTGVPYHSPGGVNYSVIDSVGGQTHDSVEVNPDVHRYDGSRDHVPGYINGTATLNGTDAPSYNDAYDVSSALPNVTSFNFTCDLNATNASCINATIDEIGKLATWQIGLFGFLAAATIICTIIGNLVVILSFILERAIRQPTNYFIASLAVSDLLIGSMSMPFYTVYLLSDQKWTLGFFMCDLWLSVDYTVCLTSIYTVFAITVDRFCSIKIPAKYRSWRTDQKVCIIIACTWIIPVLVFFTSIFGWPYFVGKRTVPDDMCYVQYLELAIFSCILQVSYFWITLLVMCVLYTGIYKVALDLQRKAEAKRKKMTSLVSIAGQTMTRIGIGMSQQGAVDARKLFSQNSETNVVSEVVSEVSISCTVNDKKEIGNSKVNNNHGASSTSFSVKTPGEKEEDRSSSPAFPSDTDPSSQSPKRSPLPKSNDAPKHHRKRPRSNSEKESKPFKLQKPPKGRKSRRASHLKAQASLSHEELRANNNINGGSVVMDTTGQNLNTASTVLPSTDGCDVIEGHENPLLADMPLDNPIIPDVPPPDYGTISPNTQSPTESKTLLQRAADRPVSPPVVTMTGGVVSASPEMLAGVKYIDQESLQSLQSNDNLRNLAEAAKVLAACKEASPDRDMAEEPDSPIWKMRDSINEKSNENSPAKSPSHNPHPARGLEAPSNTPVAPESMGNSPVFTPSPNHHPTASLTVETRGNDSRPVTQLSRSPDPDSLSEKGSVRRGKNKDRKGGSPLSSIVKTVKRSKRVGRTKSKDKSKSSRSENRARKALRTITIILGAFVLCWTPWHILSLIIGFTDPANLGPVLLKLYDISYWLCYLNSPINPFCYAVMNPQFKKTFTRILKLDWKRR